MGSLWGKTELSLENRQIRSTVGHQGTCQALRSCFKCTRRIHSSDITALCLVQTQG